MLMAITRAISPALQQCELTHLDRVPIDLERARSQHAAYEWALVEVGCTVRRLDSSPDMPDAVFVEDIAVMLGEGAIICRPGAESRRIERAGVKESLARHGRALGQITSPGTLDGGDVLVVGRQVFVGSSARTNRAGIDQLAGIVEPAGYTVRAVPVCGCLHLKSAVTVLTPDTVLVNREWVPTDVFAGLALVDVDPMEPMGANALALEGVVLYPTAFPRTRERLERLGLPVRSIDVGELQKAEGGATCCSLVFSL